MDAVVTTARPRHSGQQAGPDRIERMTEQQPPAPDTGDQDGSDQGTPAVAGQTDDGRVYVVTGQSMAVESAPEQRQDSDDSESQTQGANDRSITDMVEEPAKVMRIGNMIRQLLEEVKAAPLDDPSRHRLREIHATSITELKEGLAPELVEELDRLMAPFSDDQTPSDAELRIAQAQLVGWLEGLFHGIQTALFAQQMAARAQLEQMRRALPPGAMPDQSQGQAPNPSSGGMYL
jgi:hypothetical protein